MFLPALCRKMGVPYCIVKNKSRLGRVCRRKTTSCLAITQVESNDRGSLSKLVESVKTNFNERGDEIIALNLCDGQARGGLPSAHSSEPGLVLDNAVWDSHLTAEGGEEHDHLDGVNVVGDDHKLGFLLLNQGAHIVNTMTDNWSPLGRSIFLALS